MSDDLINCPFCNGEAELMTDEIDMSSKVGTVMCMNCYTTSQSHDDWKDAVKDWNTRHTPEAVKGVVEAVEKERSLRFKMQMHNLAMRKVDVMEGDKLLQHVEKLVHAERDVDAALKVYKIHIGE